MSLGLMKNPEGFGFPGSRNLQQYASANNAEIWIGTGIHMGVVFALIAVIFAYVMLTRHQMGLHIRLTGESPKAAKFAGVNPNKIVIYCLGFSGALAGLAGMFEVAGPSGQISIDFNAGYGFTAIIVAFLGRLNPFGIILAGLLMALTYIGGEIAQSSLGLPSAAIQAFQGMLLFFLLALDMLTNFKIKLAKMEARS
jgi:simple sugar transport system permease protein